MKVENCKFCDSLFQYPGFGEILCPYCKEKELDDIKKIRDFLYLNPEANAQMISKELEIPFKKIFYYIEQGSIILKNNMDTSKNCPNCGKVIALNEKYCNDCKTNLIKGFSTITNPKEEAKNNSSPRMRYIKL